MLAPQYGSITGINPTTGVITYVHDGMGFPLDDFQYTVDDIGGDTSNVAVVTLQFPAFVPSASNPVRLLVVMVLLLTGFAPLARSGRGR